MSKSKEIVSYTMSRIRSRDTKIEIILGKAMWASGLRYRKHFKVKGTPDFAFPGAKVAVFCDSSFWHGRDWCEEKKAKFKVNREFWVNKIERNIARDRMVDLILIDDGWTVLRFWDDEIIKNTMGCVTRVRSAIMQKRGPKA